MSPRITIITPSFQQAPFLEECLRSIHGQGYAGLEHIVVDGGSTDGSKAIIERHAERIAWWCSERDGGQSDALNKGLAHATGDVFGWINSDDMLLPGALQRVADAFAADPTLMVYGGQRIIRGDGPDRVHPLDDPNDPARLYYAPMINQQSTFFRMAAICAVGGPDPALHHVMDHDLWLRILLRFGTDHIRLEPVPLAVFRVHGTMKSLTARAAFRNEMAGVLHGLCMQCGSHQLAGVLAMGHQWPRNLRPMELAGDQRALVERIAIYFLLKWNHVIFDRDQFRMMRLFRRSVPIAAHQMDPEQNTWLAQLDEQLAVPGWCAFRLRRKWRHLRA